MGRSNDEVLSEHLQQLINPKYASYVVGDHIVEIRATGPALTTVLEINVAPAGAPTERYRRTVLLTTEMNAALKVQEDLIRGDRPMLHALKKIIELQEPSHMLVLGYDFFTKQPTVTIYV